MAGAAFRRLLRRPACSANVRRGSGAKTMLDILKTTMSPFRALVALALLAGCTGESGPAFEIVGGGFLFNYRLAEVTAGLVVVPRRAFPAGSALEMSFENPAGGAPIVVAKPVTPETTKVDFETPPLSGVKADRAYVVTVRLVDGQGKELARVDKNFRSQLDQSKLPKAPLTIGPGYAPNPQTAPDAGKP
jgi:hypothetical protein